MNSKLIKASVAGAAAIALAAGGSTFANWSDVGQLNNQAAMAGHLVLNLNAPVNASVAPLNLAPGIGEYRIYQVASNDGLSVPSGVLTMTVKNLTDTEDGCTSNSEAIAEGATPFAPGYNAATDCGTTGELSQEANVEVYQYGPSDNGQCSSVAPEAGVPSTVIQNVTYFNSISNTPLTIGTLAPGQLTCIAFHTWLAHSPSARAADDKVQGDSMAWDFQFDLTQV